MSGRLVGEVVEWLLTPAAEELNLSTAERTVLLVIAERANEENRVMWRHRGDDISLHERICRAAKLKEDGASNLFKKLAKKGLEVRIPKMDENDELVRAKDGRLIFAHHGKSMRFRLPVFPASAQMPGSPVPEPPFPVDNPADEPVDNAPEDDGSPFPEPPFEPEGRSQERASSAKGVSRNAPNPSKEDPSNYSPSTPVDPSSVVTVEDTGPAAATPPAQTSHHMGWNPTYTDARDFLFALANEGTEFMDAAAQELGPDAPIAERVIRAAHIANEKSHAA